MHRDLFFRLAGLLIFAGLVPVLCHSDPLVLYYEGKLFFPRLNRIPASVFDQEKPRPDYSLVTALPPLGKGAWALHPPFRWDPDASHLEGPLPGPPNRSHWLGTDDRGRDVLSRLLYGFRNGLFFAVAAWAFTLAMSVVIGGVQVYAGYRIDFLVQRFSESWQSLPTLYVVLFLLSLFTPSLTLLLFVWVLFGWVYLAGLFRSEVLRLLSLPYVQSARGLGQTPIRIAWHHVLPGALQPLLALSPYLILSAFSGLATLDFLGMGLPPPASTWGELLLQARLHPEAWWLIAFPITGLSLFLFVLGNSFAVPFKISSKQQIASQSAI